MAVTVPFTISMLAPEPLRSMMFCWVVLVATLAQKATVFTDAETEPMVVEALMPLKVMPWPILPGARNT